MAVRESDAEGDEAAAPKAPKAASPMKLVIVGAFALFVALVGAQVTGPLLTKMLAGDPNAAAANAADGEDAEHEAEDEHEVAPGKIEPAFYTPLDPPFVVSLNDGDGGSRYLQLTLQAMTRDEHGGAEIKQHSPALRNQFLFLLDKYKVADLSTLDGKEKLRAEMLAVANDIMVKNTGHPTIEELYFTSLVIQ